ncbi:MAG: hypothetical protein CBC29_00260 [Methylococcaceae bacterium TMED69]|nr:MAG: hypothetical protein CBC29_00260 [Methylococcaceae bacterium TMED69]|tara:strand:+ start:403 stop:906 length:504 start_codon:yes stop_codon:yes gene_type:complete
MSRNKTQRNLYINPFFIFILLISFTAVSYESYKQPQKNKRSEKLELGRVNGTLPDGLSLEFGSDITIKNQVEGKIQRIDKKNKQIIINDDIFICDSKVEFLSNNEKKIRFRNLKKGMPIRMDFEISPEGLLAKRIHLQNKTKKNQNKSLKSNKREKADQYKSNYGSY